MKRKKFGNEGYYYFYRKTNKEGAEKIKKALKKAHIGFKVFQPGEDYFIYTQSRLTKAVIP